MNNSYGKILVLMGGWSNEREISLISGKSVYNSLSYIRSRCNRVGS
jgi:D-alanine-D-alanine ligase-like ATP-grasp enzyme